MSRSVVFEETGETREIVSRCQVCFRSWDAWGFDHDGYGIISPAGLEHIQAANESTRTICGHEADGPEWWWPL